MSDDRGDEEADEGGDAACWAHRVGGVDVDLAELECHGDGVCWSLPHGGDLDANLVHLGPGGSIGRHVNDEVDVLVVVRSGGGRIDVGGVAHQLRTDVVVHVPRGTHRAIHAGPHGVSYLSIHRSRSGLSIRSASERGAASGHAGL